MSVDPRSVTATLIAPLPDLSVDDLPEGRYQLGGGLVLVSPPRVDLDADQIAWLGEGDHHGIVHSRWALQLTYDADSKVQLGQLEVDATEKIMYAAMALWITKPCCCGIRALLRFRSDNVGGTAMGVTRYAESIRLLEGHNTDGLVQGDIPALRTAASRIEECRSSRNRVDMALRYLNAGLRSEHGYPRAAMLTTVFECLLVHETQELAHRVSERYAWLMGTDAIERRGLYRAMKGFYDLRSSVVHGDGFSRQAAANLEALGVQLEIAVQRVLRRILIDDALWRTFASNKEWRAFMDALPFG